MRGPKPRASVPVGRYPSGASPQGARSRRQRMGVGRQYDRIPSARRARRIVPQLPSDAGAEPKRLDARIATPISGQVRAVASGSSSPAQPCCWRVAANAASSSRSSSSGRSGARHHRPSADNAPRAARKRSTTTPRRMQAAARDHQNSVPGGSGRHARGRARTDGCSTRSATRRSWIRRRTRRCWRRPRR